ncbi:ATP-grasp domain-containing protein [Candidatus Saccharibacteria bacterium]|nr:ATP-grasp domain-containing protein [Candidatus Saccharibacteria bacterium]
MKKILLTAAGTATTWHLCKIIESYFKNDFDIFLTDTNEKKFVPAGIFTDHFFQVPSVFDNNYLPAMHKIIKENDIDIIIPLIDFDLFYFPKDSKELKELNIVSTAPPLKTVETLTDKKKMHDFLQKNNIPTPNLYHRSNLKDSQEYIIKPQKGFGSRGVEKLLGKEAKNLTDDNLIFQEVCRPAEITAEVYNGDKLKIFQRKRVETKAGVCTKMEPVFHKQIDDSIKKLVSSIECPTAFCIQFMQNQQDNWCITDCNLRIGAGTALSTKIGFQLTRALLASLSGKEIKDDFFSIDPSIKSVLRVYDEVIIK